jgi:hypothetical protein
MINSPFTCPMFWYVVRVVVGLVMATRANPASDLVPGPGAMRSPGLRPAPQIFGPSLLAQGRHVYADLQRARAAALRRRAANLRVALTQARDTLHRLSSSWDEAGLRALERQSRIRHRREGEATAYHRGAKGPK